MKTGRRIAALAALLALTLLLPLEASAQANPRYWLQVVGDDSTVITSGYCRPLNAGLMTEPTIYSNSTLATTQSIPITINATTGECSWYQTPGRTYDVMVYVTGGNYKGATVRMDGFTGVGKAVVGRAHGTKVLVVPFTATAAVATVVASETIPPGTFVQDVVVETKTAVASSTLYVGTTRAVDLFCPAADTAAIGWTDCSAANRLWVHPSTAFAIAYSNQNHASAGYIFVFYRAPVNEP